MKKSIRIASGSGFWGDMPDAPVKQVKNGPIDYLVMDYLAEVTMSIMQKQRMKNPNYGYAHDVIKVIEQILPDIAERGIKFVTNAGGVNPESCKDAIIELIEDQGFEDITVAVVNGDDILPQIDELVNSGHHLKNIDTGASIGDVKDRLLSANAYLGARPIVEALQQDADIIITGRVYDAGLIVGPMMHEFAWDFEDYDKVATGIVAGHIIECGAQTSGGNFTDWQQVENFVDIGFPIIEAYPDGDFIVTKHEGTGGLVNEMTVKEQLVYEIADPKNYLTPDAIADFTSLHLEQDGPDSVRISGVAGRPPTDTYKVSASYEDDFRLSHSIIYSWPQALQKSEKAAEILKGRADALGLDIDEFNFEYIGLNGCNEQPVSDADRAGEFNEIELRIAASGRKREDLDRFGQEIVPLVLTGPSGVTGYAKGRPRAEEVVAYWPALLDKEVLEPRVRIFSV